MSRVYIDGHPAEVISLGGSTELSFITEIKQECLRENLPDPTPVSVTFTKDVKYAFVACGIDDNINDNQYVTFNGTPYGLTNFETHGIVKVPENKILTGLYPYSDGGAYFDYLGAIGMNRLPREFAFRVTTDRGTNQTLTFDKVYTHLAIFNAFSHTRDGSITVQLNGTQLTYTTLPSMYGRYTYYGMNEIETDTATLNFVYSTSMSANKLIVFAYNDD